MRNRRFKREETKARKDVFFCSSQCFNDILGRWGKINLTLNWRSEPNSRWGQRQREGREKRFTSSGAKERAALGVCEALSRFVCRNIGNYSRYSDHASPASPQHENAPSRQTLNEDKGDRAAAATYSFCWTIKCSCRHLRISTAAASAGSV